MTKFKVNDRVKVIVPTDKSKAANQNSYFLDWQESAIGKIGTVQPNIHCKDPEAGWLVEVKFDEPPKSVAGYECEIMVFPEWELEKVLTLDKDDE